MGTVRSLLLAAASGQSPDAALRVAAEASGMAAVITSAPEHEHSADVAVAVIDLGDVPTSDALALISRWSVRMPVVAALRRFDAADLRAAASAGAHETIVTPKGDTLAAAAAVAAVRFERQQHLVAAAETDPLTGLLNRRGLLRMGSHLLALARRQGHSVLAIMIDIDDLKLVNDTHGHATGDEYLLRMSESCRACCRASDVVARIGGDEFVWLAPGSDHAAGAAIVGRLRSATPPPPSFTSGWSSEGTELADLIVAADVRLLDAKRALGRTPGGVG